MSEGWSPAGGWEYYKAWKRWFLQEQGRVDPPPPQRPSVRLFGVYRVFSTPEGIQTEAEVATADPAAAALRSGRFRRRAHAHLVKLQEYLARDPNPVVYL